MKHNWKITFLLVSMFLLTQFVGLYVINSHVFERTREVNGVEERITNPILSNLQPPEIEPESDPNIYLTLAISIIFSFVVAIVILFLLTKFKVNIIMKIWFFSVIAIALFITFCALFPNYIASLYFIIPAVILALVLSIFKVFKRSFIIHNLTEILIYPGIATLFVPILNLWSVLILLLLISVYDIWAVWHSGIMQKMAKYQINNLKMFSGFFVPYISKKMRMQMKKLKKDKKNKNKHMKVNIAILGGGDVIFPIITAGVVLTMETPLKLLPGFTGGLLPAIFVVLGATLGLTLLFLFSEKKKFYPAMPFITAGILLGLVLSYIIL